MVAPVRRLLRASVSWLRVLRAGAPLLQREGLSSHDHFISWVRSGPRLRSLTVFFALVLACSKTQHGRVVDDWPDGEPVPHGWSISRRLTALDSAAGVVSGGAALSTEEVFECLPRGLQRRRFQVETDLSRPGGDAFERGQALRLAEVLVRELLNIADLAEQSAHVPWDAGTSDPGVLARAARAAADYIRGFSDSALRMGGARSAPNGIGAAGDRALGDSSSLAVLLFRTGTRLLARTNK